MVDAAVKALLLKKLGNISHQALSQRADTLKKQFGPMTTEEAVYVIAHQNGIDLSRHLPIGTVDKIRALVPRQLPESPRIRKTEKKKPGRSKRPTSVSYPLVKNKTLLASVKIGENAFPKMFVLENSIRSLIKNVMSKSFGSGWWTRALPRKRRDIIDGRIEKEKNYPHRRKRGTHQIYYSDFSDLKNIILQNHSLFENIILDFTWFKVKMDEVYMARNSLAHNVEIDEQDIARINIFYTEWANILGNSGY